MTQPSGQLQGIDETVNAFLAHLDRGVRSGRYTRNTRKYYRWALSHFRVNFDAWPDQREIIDLVDTLELSTNGGAPVAVGTKRSYYEAVRDFYRWARAYQPGCQALPDLRYHGFGRKRHRRRA